MSFLTLKGETTHAEALASSHMIITLLETNLRQNLVKDYQVNVQYAPS
jgi:hypothetical protein